MRRWVLSKRDRRRLSARLAELYPGFSLEADRVEVVVEDDVTLYLFDGLPAFFEVGDRPLPHLLFLLRRGYSWLPSIKIDQGAVRPISRGADLMRPGVVEIRGSFSPGDVVVVVEPSRGLPLAIHEALYSSDEIKAMEKGRVARSLHHVGDRIWKLAENL